jgi:hypothetical protein
VGPKAALDILKETKMFTPDGSPTPNSQTGRLYLRVLSFCNDGFLSSSNVSHSLHLHWPVFPTCPIYCLSNST